MQMSDFKDGIYGLILLMVLGLVISYFSGYDLRLGNWNKEDKIEKWIEVEKSKVDFSEGLDKRWVNAVTGSLKIKGKIRNSLKDSNYFDFAYVVDVKLTRPFFDKSKKIEKAKFDSYYIIFEFDFIDEEGFVIYTFAPYGGSFDHETLESFIRWTKEKYPREVTETTFKSMHLNAIPEKMAKRTSKIRCRPLINIRKNVD